MNVNAIGQGPAEQFRVRVRPAARRIKQLYYRAVGRQPRLVPFDYMYPKAARTTALAAETANTPEALLMPFIDNAEYLRCRSYTTPEDFSVILDDVLYCPINHVLMGPRRQVIAETLMYQQYLWEEVLRMRSEEWIGGVSTLLQNRHDAYYHLLVDNLPRLLCLEHPAYSGIPEVQLLSSRPLFPVEEWLLGRLALPNVKVLQLSRDSLYRLQRVIFTPFKTREECGYIPSFYRDRIRAAVLPNRPSRRSHRLFISRADASSRRIANENEVTRGLRDLGFESVVLSKFSPADQVELFYDAEAVVGVHGSGLTNLLFAEAVGVVELFPSGRVTPHYYFLSKSLGHRYAYWCGTQEEQDVDVFEVDAQTVVDTVRTVLHS